MATIVGKYAGLFGLLCSLAVQADVHLYVKDLNGLPLKTVQANYPFKVELEVEDADRRVEHPTIKGLEAFSNEGRESRMNIINGQTTITYGYRVRAAHPGQYSFGPIELTVRGAKLISNPATVEVVPAAAQSAQSKDDAAATTAFARLTLDKDHAVVGEKIKGVLRFYYRDAVIDLRNVGEPQLDQFTCANRKGPMAGMQAIDGTDYHYIEWQWDLYPKKAGDICLSAYRFDYTVPSQEKTDDLFAAFAFFARERRVQKRLYSNAVNLTVRALPDHEGPVHAIGNFSRFSARMKPPVAQEGEGMVLTLEVEGDGDLDSVELSPLALGSEFSWYDSKNFCAQAQNKDSAQKKSFEYIVQGMKPGNWVIPSQQFTYFDVTQGRYKTYTTSPIEVTIKPNARLAAAHAVPKEKIGENPGAVEQAVDVQEDEIRPIYQDGPMHSYKERAMPWWFFVLLIFVPLIAILFAKMKGIRTTSGKPAKTNKKEAFARARTALKTAEEKQAYGQIYPIFINLFVACLELAQDVITEDAIEDALVQAKMSPADLGRWRGFFNRIAEIVFAAKGRVEQDAQGLFKQAEDWLNTLEKLV